MCFELILLAPSVMAVPFVCCKYNMLLQTVQELLPIFLHAVLKVAQLVQFFHSSGPRAVQ